MAEEGEGRQPARDLVLPIISCVHPGESNFNTTTTRDLGPTGYHRIAFPRLLCQVVSHLFPGPPGSRQGVLFWFAIETRGTQCPLINANRFKDLFMKADHRHHIQVTDARGIKGFYDRSLRWPSLDTSLRGSRIKEAIAFHDETFCGDDDDADLPKSLADLYGSLMTEFRLGLQNTVSWADLSLLFTRWGRLYPFNQAWTGTEAQP
ncbi:hypothetical protein PABG_12033 [Paracoccidioides brasiliensis Pb03]|nr:hypothetical protein PABG_12033 [Paracoccidioides brasiliensis Pb03]